MTDVPILQARLIEAIRHVDRRFVENLPSILFDSSSACDLKNWQAEFTLSQHTMIRSRTRIYRMAIRKCIQTINWRAAGVLFIVLLWWMTPAIALALPERIECGTECCLTAGHCCCLTRFDQSDEDHESHPETGIARVELGQTCPANCATLTAPPQVVSRLVHHSPSSGESRTEAALPFEIRFAHHHNSPSTDPSSPRAPPSFA